MEMAKRKKAQEHVKEQPKIQKLISDAAETEFFAICLNCDEVYVDNAEQSAMIRCKNCFQFSLLRKQISVNEILNNNEV